MTKLATCKRCGARNLAWVQSKKTGRYYLALTNQYHSIQNGPLVIPGGIAVLAHRPHKCDEERPVCDTCGYRHDRSGSLMDHQWRMDGGRIVENGYEMLYRGENPKVVHDPELPRKEIS